MRTAAGALRLHYRRKEPFSAKAVIHVLSCRIPALCGYALLDESVTAGQHPCHLASLLAARFREWIAFWIQAVRHGRLPVKVGFVLALSAFYLLTTSRERPWTDGSFVYFTAERLVTDHTTTLPFAAVLTSDGTMQSPHPLLTSLVHVPGAIIKTIWMKVWRGGEGHLLVLASHLAPAVLMAGTCWLFLTLCRLLNLGRRASFTATALLAFGTIVWVYARSPWPPAVETFVFTGFFVSVLRLLKAPSERTTLALGLWAAALINARWSFVVLVPTVGVWLVWKLREKPESQAWLGTRTLPLMLVGFAWLFIESRFRFGTAFYWWSTLASAPMKQNVVMGLWGLFLSPGKSLLVYSPPLVLGLAGLTSLWRSRTHDVFVLWLLSLAPVFLHLALLNHWTGDWCWGPRFCVFATPVMMLPAAVLIDGWMQRNLRLAVAPLALAASVGLSVQVLGNALYWDHYIRVAKQARIGWLGTPNRTGALNPVVNGECDPCFEDIHPMTWLAPFNPIEGHWWLLQHVLRGDDAATAERDAAWHRYTWVKFRIDESYARARVDWWFLNFLPKRWGKGVGSLAALLGLCWLGLWLLKRALARPDAAVLQ